MKFTALVLWPPTGEWRLLRDVSVRYVRKLEIQGWTIIESWNRPRPSVDTVLLAVRDSKSDTIKTSA